MTEAVAAIEAPPVAPPPDVVPAEAVNDVPEQTGSAPATQPESVKPESATEDAQEKRAGSRRFERRIASATRRAAEEKARADFLEKRIAELEKSSPRQQADPDEPKIEQFSDLEEFKAAVAKHAAGKERGRLESERRAQEQRQFVEKLTHGWEEKVEKASDKYEDFDSVVGELQPVNPLCVAIMDEDNGADVAYHLAKNHAEAQRIAQLHPIAQAREVGKLAAKLAAEPAKPKTPSKAPAPITPVGGKSGGANDMPQDSDDINTWMKKERAREMKLRGG